jgi:hypothetical protein
MACKMPFELGNPTILHPWGCPCLVVIEGHFVPKSVEQFGYSSQDLDLEYKKYLMLLIQKQLILVVQVEKRKKKGEL